MAPDVQIASDSDLDGMLEELKASQPSRYSVPKYNCCVSGCNANFKRLDHLDRHEYHHTGAKRHACSYEDCDKSYATITHLKRHLRSKHERPAAPQKSINCSLPECCKMFTSESNMQRHLRDTHENPREYTCTYCSAKFRQKVKLRRHEITQHTQEYPYRCEKCARGFYQQWQQERHQRNCKLYACAQCELKFEKLSLYTKHCRETLHSRQRQKCGHCERSYVKFTDLTAHISAKHSADNELTFPCVMPGCNRSYTYERNLRQHVLTAHSGRRFQCLAVGCQSCFSSAQNLSKHLLREHTVKQCLPVTKKASPIPCSIPVEEASRKHRKDVGRTARSHLCKIAGLVLDRSVDKKVGKREPVSLKHVTNDLHKQQSQTIYKEINEVL